jgi:hypothetical protein
MMMMMMVVVVVVVVVVVLMIHFNSFLHLQLGLSTLSLRYLRGTLAVFASFPCVIHELSP